MIGWENSQGAYFINKLQGQIDDLVTKDTTLQTEIGTLSNLTTTAKSNLVSAVNELDSDIGDTNTALNAIKTSASSVTLAEGVTNATLVRSQCYISNGLMFVTGYITVTSTGIAKDADLLVLPYAVPTVTDFSFNGSTTVLGYVQSDKVKPLAKLNAGGYSFNFIVKKYEGA